jgi:hypothetical protein
VAIVRCAVIHEDGLTARENPDNIVERARQPAELVDRGAKETMSGTASGKRSEPAASTSVSALPIRWEPGTTQRPLVGLQP